jgi:hypothetical protein
VGIRHERATFRSRFRRQYFANLIGNTAAIKIQLSFRDLLGQGHELADYASKLLTGNNFQTPKAGRECNISLAQKKGLKEGLGGFFFLF